MQVCVSLDLSYLDMSLGHAGASCPPPSRTSTFSPSIISYVSSVLAGGKFEVQFMGDAYNHFVCKDYPVLFRRTCSLRHLGEMGGDLGKESVQSKKCSRG
jgi:hypothetical protein